MLLPFFGFSKAKFSTRLLATYNIQFHIRCLQQRIATFACVAEVFWDHGVSCSRCRSGRCVATHVPQLRTRSHSLTFTLFCRSLRSLCKPNMSEFELLPAWAFWRLVPCYEKKIKENTVTTSLQAKRAAGRKCERQLCGSASVGESY